ncbi:MAG: ATP-binding protein [Campylobacterota bacterium]|nr:ATP-binding protein [Campylobacterota bacterium]
MRNGITLSIPNDISYCEIVKAAITNLCNKVGFDKRDLDDLIKATRELVENAIIHAYPGSDGLIEISLHTFEHGIRVDVRDWGVPMSPNNTHILPIDHEEDRGFNHIYTLVDKFHYKNLGKKGKRFTIIKHTALPLEACQIKETGEKELTEIEKKNLQLIIRDFKKGDEEDIARLIYQNYGLSYVKEDFYYPKKILTGQGKKFVSIVLEANKTVIGHFALIIMRTSNICEIGIVVVDPRYKGMGMMNKMFDYLITKAHEMKLSAVFGEAIMYHTFSQKSNLTHHFCESALVLGKTTPEIRIENNELTEKERRGSVLIGYRFFEHRKRRLYLPGKHRDQILVSYKNCALPYELKTPKKKCSRENTNLYYRYDPIANVAKIIISRYGKDFKYQFVLMLDQLRAKHCDMIYSDINLEKIPQIEKVIKILNKEGFFYAGVLFLKYYDQDYLRLQNRHSEIIGKKNLVCYSEYCHTLLDYIHLDEYQNRQKLKGKKKM